MTTIRDILRSAALVLTLGVAGLAVTSQTVPVTHAGTAPSISGRHALLTT